MPFLRSGARSAGPEGGGLGWFAVQWLFTGLLVVASAGTAVYTGYLLRRLFTTPPGRPDVEPTP